jgi:cytochrome c-type biogenesis protein CcmH
VRRFAVLAAAALALAPAASGSEQHPTLNELENEIMCPVCTVPLAQSDSPAAKRMEAIMKGQIAKGWTKSRIEKYWVRQLGESILASPPKHGFDLLAWVLPLAGVALAAAVLGVAAFRWRGRLPPEPPAALGSLNGRGRLEPELERRVDEELARFDA